MAVFFIPSVAQVKEDVFRDWRNAIMTGRLSDEA
jgi:hypothetical protein